MKQKLPIEMTENGIHYTLHGDYYFPDTLTGAVFLVSYDEIRTLNQPVTRFPSHCDRNKTPGVDMTTGSLGQGSSLAVGQALGDRLKGRHSRTFLILGDGEMDEGQPWEAALLAAHRGLDNMIWFIDWNKKQLDATWRRFSSPSTSLRNSGPSASIRKK